MLIGFAYGGLACKLTLTSFLPASTVQSLKRDLEAHSRLCTTLIVSAVVREIRSRQRRKVIEGVVGDPSQGTRVGHDERVVRFFCASELLKMLGQEFSIVNVEFGNVEMCHPCQL